MFSLKTWITRKFPARELLAFYSTLTPSPKYPNRISINCFMIGCKEWGDTQWCVTMVSLSTRTSPGTAATRGQSTGPAYRPFGFMPKMEVLGPVSLGPGSRVPGSWIPGVTQPPESHTGLYNTMYERQNKGCQPFQQYSKQVLSHTSKISTRWPFRKRTPQGPPIYTVEMQCDNCRAKGAELDSAAASKRSRCSVWHEAGAYII